MCRSEHDSSNGAMGSNDRWKRGVGADDVRRPRRLGVQSSPLRAETASANEARRIAGVKPLDPTSTSCTRGPGSEKRTFFLRFCGVLTARAWSEDKARLCLVRWETGSSSGELDTQLLLRFLPVWVEFIAEEDNGSIENQPNMGWGYVV
jgi:hypothetical protein